MMTAHGKTACAPIQRATDVQSPHVIQGPQPIFAEHSVLFRYRTIIVCAHPGKGTFAVVDIESDEGRHRRVSMLKTYAML